MRKTICFLALAASYLLTAGPALGASSPRASMPGTVHFSQGSYTAHESQGYLPITITRTDATGIEYVRYGVRQQSAIDGHDFDTIGNTLATFLPGQYTYTFKVHIYDLGMNAPPRTAMAYLFGSYPQTLTTPNNSQIILLRDDPLGARDPVNPLGLNPAPANGNAIQNANFYVAGPSSNAGKAADALRRTDPASAASLSVIANAPGARRFYFWNEPDPSSLVAGYLEQTQTEQPGTAVQLSTYSLVHGHCQAGHSDSPSLVNRYRHWIDLLAQGIGNFHVVMFFEIDSLITTGCLSPHGLNVRLHDELHWAIDRLEQDPHVVLYLDAGAADAKPWREDARMLHEAGVADAQGFFLNGTHRDWTTKELYYGQRISRVLGGAHFVINTGGNGRGPLVPADRARDGNEVLCNPPGRGLGPFTTETGYKWADGFLWFDNPGGSGGPCRPGAPPTATYWPAYAVMLVRNAVYKVTGPHYPLTRDPSSFSSSMRP